MGGRGSSGKSRLGGRSSSLTGAAANREAIKNANRALSSGNKTAAANNFQQAKVGTAIQVTDSRGAVSMYQKTSEKRWSGVGLGVSGTRMSSRGLAENYTKAKYLRTLK